MISYPGQFSPLVSVVIVVNTAAPFLVGGLLVEMVATTASLLVGRGMMVAATAASFLVSGVMVVANAAAFLVSDMMAGVVWQRWWPVLPTFCSMKMYWVESVLCVRIYVHSNGFRPIL